MSIGHPGESEQSALDVRNWLIKMEIDDFDCTIITTYPGTPYYDYAIPHDSHANVWTYTQPQTGDRLHAYDIDFTTTPDYYKGDPDGGYRAYVFTDYLTSSEIVRLRNQIEREVRESLCIPFNQSRAALRFEHSMGQGLPDFILKVSDKSRRVV
jgi:anaerobic magnesium-protoporphyrin IX monomethyl ester cyclase